MIVGAQKAATTSLKNYLSEHPSVSGHLQTEFSYFVSEEEYRLNYAEIYTHCFDNKRKTYDKVIAKNAVMYTHEQSINRLLQHNKDCQLVYLVRNPVERAYSSYTMEVSSGWMKRDFDEIVEIIRTDNRQDIMYKLFIQLGLYADYLEMMCKYFPRESIHIILFEKLKEQPTSVCRNIFKLLNVDDTFIPDIETIHNSTQKTKSDFLTDVLMRLRNNENIVKKTVKAFLPRKTFTKLGQSAISFNKSNARYDGPNEVTRAKLVDFFKPHNDRLQEMTGIKLDHWNV